MDTKELKALEADDEIVGLIVRVKSCCPRCNGRCLINGKLCPTCGGEGTVLDDRIAPIEQFSQLIQGRLD